MSQSSPRRLSLSIISHDGATRVDYVCTEGAYEFKRNATSAGGWSLVEFTSWPSLAPVNLQWLEDQMTFRGWTVAS